MTRDERQALFRRVQARVFTDWLIERNSLLRLLAENETPTELQTGLQTGRMLTPNELAENEGVRKT